MSKNAYADDINNAKLMLSGMKKNPDRMSKRGLDGDFMTVYQTNYGEAQELDNEQESLKAKLKETTDKLDKKMTELNKQTSEAKKIVKIEIEQTRWKEFGINDKK
jgi:hypothetical protein